MERESIRVLVIDDQALFREALGQMLKQSELVRVEALCDGVKTALDLLAEKRIDVALVVSSRSGQTRLLSILQKLQEHCRHLPILVIRTHNDSQDILTVLAEGAKGYLTRTASRRELLAAIQAVAGGGVHLSRAVARPFLERLKEVVYDPVLPRLDEREKTVLALVVAGKKNQEIARELHLSISRVKFHLRELFEKFGVSDRTSLAVEAARVGVKRKKGPVV